MKVVLINPPDISVIKGIPRMGGTLFGEPLGLAYLASVLERAGFQVDIIDYVGLGMERTLNWEYICKSLENSSPDILGITTTTAKLMSVIILAKKFKQFHKIPVILGGHGVFSIEKMILQRVHEIDVVVTGEGEKTIVELVKGYQEKSSLAGIKGIFFRHDGKIIENQPRPFIKNLDAIPFPARHLLPMETYLRSGITQVITSRGCPHSCIFCSSSLFWGHRFRARSAKNVVDEIQYIYENYKKQGLKSFYYGDDNFTANKKRVLEICNLILERKLEHLNWICQVRVDCADEELFQAMRNAGCQMIEIGVESGSNEVLRIIKKKITTDMVKKCVKIAHDVGIKVHANFIIGLPGDSKETIQQTVKFSDEVAFDQMAFQTTQVYPSTELAKHKKIDWLNFLIEEELKNPITILPFFHPCVPTYCDRDEMKKVLGQILIHKKIRHRKFLRFVLGSFLHPFQPYRVQTLLTYFLSRLRGDEWFNID